MQVSTNLADNLKWMGWNGAWHATNSLDGNSKDAASNKADEREYFIKIGGNVGEFLL